MGTVKSKAAAWLSSILLFLLLATAFAAERRPGVSRTWFEDTISNILYFDDSDVALVVDMPSGILHKSTDGGSKWSQVEDIPKGEVFRVVMNPHSKKTAVALGRSQTHWITTNKGEDWRKFEINGIPAYKTPPLLSFHAEDEERIILNVYTQKGPRAVYTTDAFTSRPDTLRKDVTLRCLWAKEQENFDSGDASINKDRTICVAPGKYSQKMDDQRILMSDDYFKTETEPGLEENRPVAGIVSVVAVKAFLLAARQDSGSNEMSLFVSTDSNKWHRAAFGGHQLKQEGYTVMESTNYSLQVDIATGAWGTPPMGALFTSNSLGYSFVRNENYTNRNRDNYVDFEKMTNIQGIVMVNIVANAEEVKATAAPKKVKSQISFDDGRTFQDVETVEGDKLHLHSVTELSNVGKVFFSMAPGIAMGVGNTGEQLKDYSEGDLYVTDDAGLTWRHALKGPHKYEFGDQGNVLLAIEDRGETRRLSYSVDHGKRWEDISLDDYEFKDEGDKRDVDITPYSLTTVPDSTTLKFLLKATAGKGSDMHHYIYTIDFNDLKKKKCKSDDFEEWWARTKKNGEPRCLMGHKLMFRRRKADADCFIAEKFEDPKPVTTESCVCRDVDYECDEGFTRSDDRKTCVPLEPRDPPKGACEKDSDTFEDVSGFRLIPGNLCKEKNGPPKGKESKIQRPCSHTKAPSSAPSNGEITQVITNLQADKIEGFYYLERGRSSEGDDETVIALTDERKAWITHDHGKRWAPVDVKSDILAIYTNRGNRNQVYLITPTNEVYYSMNRGRNAPWRKFSAPAPANNAWMPIIRFHPKREQWLIWTSCAKSSSKSCEPEAWVSRKNGAENSWSRLRTTLGRAGCDFVWREGRNSSVNLVYCMEHREEDMNAPFRLVSSNDWFEENETELFSDAVNFATMSEFIVVAAKEGRKSQFLKVDASVDGKQFADAKLPKNLKVDHSMAYTVLDSSTGAIFLHVTVNNKRDQQMGAIVKSNSNGTSYTLSLSNVNRNYRGFVDFEKLLGLEGVAVANVVSNVKEVESGSSKKLQTMITHDDGATWGLIDPPQVDVDGKPYSCAGAKKAKCSLHLHGYTERRDFRDTYSSPSAVGLMFGVGNVGPYLKPKREGDTFISSDGGVTWKVAKSGQHMWEFGDRGSVIVIVPESATRVVYYSQDEGKKWTEHTFASEDMIISDITTVPSDTARNFLLWGKTTGHGAQASTVNLDFSGLTSRKCEGVEEPGTKKSDYYFWEPKHPDDTVNKANCLFGHVSKYIRKKPGRTCYNPPNFPEVFQGIKKHCKCTRQDFECNFNYERQNDGTCKPVKGLRLPDPKAQCAKDPEKTTYWGPSGYRRLKLTTCKGGKELDKIGEPHPCPGKEEDFEKEHGGLGGAGLFFAVVIPILAAVAVGYYMWKHIDARFGRIRLGDGNDRPSPSGNGYGSSHSGKALVKYPVMAVSGVVAVAMAVPMVVGVLWRSVRERLPGGRRSFYSTYGGGTGGVARPYTSRDSFARGGRDYSDGPHNDERDLLGDDSDDEI